MDQLTNNDGYIAITTMLVIAAVVLVVSVTISLVSINEGQLSLAAMRNDNVLDIVEGCAEDALLYVNENNSLPASVSLPEGTCTITINSQSGSNWTFTTTATVNSHTKSIRIALTRSSTITISNWEEL
jgi:hypothetical protein